MFGLIKKGNSYQVQYRVPGDVREHFDGLKKKSKTIDADIGSRSGRRCTGRFA